MAAYADAELQGPGAAWKLGAAVRPENLEDFGSAVNEKLAGRVRIVSALALRTSASTGFRAPTPAQQGAFDVQTNLDLTFRELINDGTVPPHSSAAALRGGGPLGPETSRNYTGGIVLERGGFVLTTDVFRIDVADCIALTGFFKDLTSAETDILNAQGVGRLS